MYQYNKFNCFEENCLNNSNNKSLTSSNGCIETLSNWAILTTVCSGIVIFWCVAIEAIISGTGKVRSSSWANTFLSDRIMDLVSWAWRLASMSVIIVWKTWRACHTNTILKQRSLGRARLTNRLNCVIELICGTLLAFRSLRIPIFRRGTGDTIVAIPIRCNSWTNTLSLRAI